MKKLGNAGFGKLFFSCFLSLVSIFTIGCSKSSGGGDAGNIDAGHHDGGATDGAILPDAC